MQPGFEGITPPDWVRRRLGEGLGGVTLFTRNIAGLPQSAALIAELRAENPDVIIGVDEESGEVTRLEASHGSSRPGSYALGVVDDLDLTESIARDLGRDLAQVGLTVNFAPSADVNSNPDNPVIGLRSFGPNPDLVARHVAAWVRGLQSAGVAACAKHFPGHGDTSVDSHHTVPKVTASREELEEVALLPFRAAIEAGVRTIMSGHLVVPAFDPDTPATLSPRIMLQLLREEMGFDGLIITDGIEMAAIAAAYGIAGGGARAIAAGADLVCVGGEHSDEGTATALRDAIADAVVEGWLPEERLADAARRVKELADWHAQAVRDAVHVPASQNGSVPVGLAAARRALRVVTHPGSAFLPLPTAPHVVELVPVMSLAIDRGTRWGVAEPLAALMEGTTSVRLHAGQVDAGKLTEVALTPAAGRPLVVVVRDVHRFDWMEAALEFLLRSRQDAIVVEMGLPRKAGQGAVHIATYGAARVCGQVAAEVLTGAITPERTW
ncbi:glycoside hydrolase family 3 protein [Rhizohabitans arisaemae]|uniref:glycoside hydrolase family 3 protein n=1 Tax=Rhizohabitans arisaemae TaxID=2720610 RepID=UPI0024B1B5F5|nr:glycoside hydrolase family 3 N-terminal domain-containing protein [Rhizohabitans arisaemae]